MNREEKENLMELARIVDRKSTTDQMLKNTLRDIEDLHLVKVNLGNNPREEGKLVASRLRALVRRRAKKQRLDIARRKAVRALNQLGRDGLVSLFRKEYCDVTYFHITEWMRGESKRLDVRAERALRSIQL